MQNFLERGVAFNCNMFKALILSSRSEITRIVISILLLLLYVRPSIQQLSLTEGQDAELTFPYPCNSTEVTLQHGYKTPFYHLTSPENQGQRLRVENRISDGNCSLDLTINDVMRSDQGTYISSVYKDGEILIDETHRIWLGIQHGEYPPGKASCVEETDRPKNGEWVSIECTADKGSQKGKIECFQNGELMPYLTNPVETHTTLTQTILVRSTQPVFCCSSTLNENKGRCACNDTALYLPDDSITDPCPITTTSTTTIMYTMPFIYNSTELTTDKPTKINKGNNKSRIANYILVTISVSFLSVVIILIVYFKWKIKTRSNQNNKGHPQKSISLLEKNSSEREDGVKRG